MYIAEAEQLFDDDDLNAAYFLHNEKYDSTLTLTEVSS